MNGKFICLLCFISVINYTSVGNGSKEQDDLESKEKEKKLEYKRLGVDGEITNKKSQADKIMGSIQLGIQFAVKSLASKPKRGLLKSDFGTIETVVFPRRGTDHTPPHHFPGFTFKLYSPIVFQYFRNLFKTQPDKYQKSFCSSPLRELSNPGASGSIFYITQDDKFIMKTLQKKESIFLQKILPKYYSNLNRNPSTLLPKFYGLYRYQQNSKKFWTSFTMRKNKKKFTLVVMNNLIPSNLKLHQKYDLKGSTYKRKASKTEKKKSLPTFKDLDFKERHPNGIFLEPEVYSTLLNTLQRDCRFLESSKVMDYSLLMGVRIVKFAQKTKKNLSLKVLHNFINVKNDASLMEGIPAISGNGDRLLLFVGIIDILQRYSFEKKLEHAYKAIIHDGNTISVHRPRFYATRFLNFMTKYVFKKLSGPLK